MDVLAVHGPCEPFLSIRSSIMSMSMSPYAARSL